MGSIFCLMKEFLEEDDWPVSVEESGAKLKTNFPGKSATFPCLAWAREQYGQFVFYAESPAEVPVDRRVEVAEFIARANFDMVLGSIQLDFVTGTLRLKVSAELKGSEAERRELVSGLAYFAAAVMDFHHPFIQTVIDSRCTPEQAFEDLQASKSV